MPESHIITVCAALTGYVIVRVDAVDLASATAQPPPAASRRRFFNHNIAAVPRLLQKSFSVFSARIVR